MALRDGYGVVIGRVTNHYIDEPDREGRWPHYNIRVSTPAGEYACVINLKSRTEVKIEYKEFRTLYRPYFSPIVSLGNGFYRLVSNPTSGALDFIRHKGLQDTVPVSTLVKLIWRCMYTFRLVCVWRYIIRLFIRTCDCTAWTKESGLNAVETMRRYIEGANRVYIFGEPYNTGLGIHNVHMNQGDPVGTSFALENAIWQDGGILFEYPDGRLSGIITKFETQSLNTDDSGRPIPA